MNSEKDDAFVSWLDMAEKYDIFEIDEDAEDSGSCRKDIIIDHLKICQTKMIQNSFFDTTVPLKQWSQRMHDNRRNVS